MTYNVLLYGATGYSGGLIAAEGKERGMSTRDGGNFRMVLAGRNGGDLASVAEKNGMDFRIFGLDDPDEIRKGLDGIDVVINAAGPFALTAERLVKAALAVGCHYVDINGEIDVYMKLDDLGRMAAHRGVAIVSAAGDTAGASDILLDAALKRLTTAGRGKEGLGTIRIGVSQVTDFSRGSARTAARLLREQVITVRKGRRRDRGKWRDQLVVWHEPIGTHEHAFGFSDRENGNRQLAIASAANLIDTLTARSAVVRYNLSVEAIKSYIEMGTLGRIAYQLGGMLAAFSTLPLVGAIANAQLGFLPADPAPRESVKGGHVVVLEIEDPYRTRLIDWRLKTPDVYQFTAQLVVAVARSVTRNELRGWTTPSAALDLPDGELSRGDEHRDRALRGCTLQGLTA